MPALTKVQVVIIEELRGMGLPVGDVALAAGVHRSTVVKHASQVVDNAELREYFERSGMTACQLARDLEWWNGVEGRGRRPDASRVRRTLGITRSRRRINRRLALKVALAMGVDPVDVGI